MKGAGIAFILIVVLLGLQYHYYLEGYEAIKNVSLDNIYLIRDTTGEALRNIKSCFFVQLFLLLSAGIALFVSDADYSRDIKKLETRISSLEENIK